MADTIQLNGTAYPFAKTSEGEKLLKQLDVTLQAVEQRKPEALKRYAYCMAAGASKSEKRSFPFTVAQFVKACPANWKKQTFDLLHAKAVAKAETKKK